MEIFRVLHLWGGVDEQAKFARGEPDFMTGFYSFSFSFFVDYVPWFRGAWNGETRKKSKESG